MSKYTLIIIFTLLVALTGSAVAYLLRANNRSDASTVQLTETSVQPQSTGGNTSDTAEIPAPSEAPTSPPAPSPSPSASSATSSSGSTNTTPSDAGTTSTTTTTTNTTSNTSGPSSASTTPASPAASSASPQTTAGSGSSTTSSATTTDSANTALTDPIEKSITVRRVISTASNKSPIAISFTIPYPNYAVTLTIHSDPIVVKTKSDKNGVVYYELTEDLPEGEHTLTVQFDPIDGTTKPVQVTHTFLVPKVEASSSLSTTASTSNQSPQNDMLRGYIEAVLGLIVLASIIAYGIYRVQLSRDTKSP